MANIRDKALIKDTRKGAQTIQDTVAFSGSDIDVIAYRYKTPASKFKVDSLDRAIAQKERSIRETERARAEAEASIASAQQGIADITNKKKQLLASGVPQDSTSMSRLNDKEGKFQKKISSAQSQASFVDDQLAIENNSLRNLQGERDALEGGSNYFNLGSIHTISYSSFREKHAVRTLGRVHAKDYTRGQRTIAGTLVFNVFQQHELLKMVDFIERADERHPDAVMLDQIQPFNLLLLFANEYGAYSSLHLFNVDLASEGQEMSVDQIITTNTMNFYATDMIPMTNIGNRFASYDEMIIGSIQDVSSLGYTSGAPLARNNIDNLINPFSEDAETDLLSRSRGLF